jgi:hypothetical protein
MNTYLPSFWRVCDIPILTRRIFLPNKILLPVALCNVVHGIQWLTVAEKVKSQFFKPVSPQISSSVSVSHLILSPPNESNASYSVLGCGNRLSATSQTVLRGFFFRENELENMNTLICYSATIVYHKRREKEKQILLPVSSNYCFICIFCSFYTPKRFWYSPIILVKLITNHDFFVLIHDSSVVWVWVTFTSTGSRV